MLAARITFYSLTLFFCFSQTVMGSMTASINWSEYLSYFGGVAAGVSGLSWIWISVLLSYNDRPESNNFLTRSSVHLCSFVTISILSLATGIMIATQTKNECTGWLFDDGLSPLWCGLSIGSAVAGMLSFLSAAISAIIILVDSRKPYGGLSGNVAESDRMSKDAA